MQLSQVFYEDVHENQELPALAKEVTRVQIARYAGASGDFNPIHLDDEFATGRGLGGVIAHGMLSVGFISQFLVDWVGDPGAVKSLQVRFSAMVRPGDTVRVTGRVVRKREDGLIDCALEVRNQRDEPVIAPAAATLALPTRA